MIAQGSRINSAKIPASFGALRFIVAIHSALMAALSASALAAAAMRASKSARLSFQRIVFQSVTEHSSS
jgi:hypothetical protein